MDNRGIKVGELARRSGVSVRALHYYDEIGLLSPRRYGDGDHRVYGASEVARLQQIVSLRQLGFPLEEIRACLGGSDASLLDIVEQHLTRLDEQVRLQQQLRDRLQVVAGWLRDAEEVSVDELLKTIEMTIRMEDYYTPEQREKLRERAKQVGPDRMREVEQEWRDLFAAVRVAMDRGTDPTKEPVLTLGRKWQGLIDEFTGGDPGIGRSLGRMNSEEPEHLERHGFALDATMMEYIGRALRALKQSP